MEWLFLLKTEKANSRDIPHGCSASIPVLAGEKEARSSNAHDGKLLRTMA